MTLAGASSAPAKFAIPTFSDSSRIRLFLGSVLYLAQGLPQGVMFYGLAAWLAANGQSAAAVGAVVAAVSIPWTLKFLLGALLDRYAYLPMGRRRAWLVGAQFGIIASMVVFGLVNPSADQISLLITFAFIMSLLTATQDVALDAMVIDLTPEEELGNINGFMFGGKILGIAIGTAATGYFAQYHGLDVALFVMAAAFSVPAIFALLVRERSGERLLPWTEGVTSPTNLDRLIPAWLPILKNTLKSMWTRDVMIVVFMSLTYGLYQVMGETAFPLLSSNRLGWGEAQFTALVGTTNLILAPLSLLAGGLLIDRIGPKLISILAGLATMGALITYAMAQTSWPNEMAFYAMYVGSTTPAMLLYLALLVLMMRVCDPVVAATTFTLMTSAQALGRTLAGLIAGPIDGWGGLQALILCSAAFIALSGLCTWFLSAKAGGALAKEDQLSPEPDGGPGVPAG